MDEPTSEAAADAEPEAAAPADVVRDPGAVTDPSPTDQPGGGGAGDGDGTVPPAGGVGAERGRRRRRALVEWLVVLAIAAALALGARAFVAQTYWIPSASMQPTLQVGDRILVDKLSYDLHAVHRGDIVVFSRPPGAPPNDADLVKRVIGLPGETISSAPDGTVLIDGRPIAEPWLTSASKASPGGPIARQVIPAGDYFVMGDNRDCSEDSRVFGPIQGSTIVGRVVMRIWPVGSIGLFSSTERAPVGQLQACTP